MLLFSIYVYIYIYILYIYIYIYIYIYAYIYTCIYVDTYGREQKRLTFRIRNYGIITVGTHKNHAVDI